MRNVKLTIEYDGTNYQGWQIQGQAPTIQKIFEEAIPRVVQHPLKVIGSGRTDSGVHAVGQVANFHTESKIPASKLVHAINSYLPKDIAVLTAKDVPHDFHARYSAREKTYRYTILNRDVRSPLQKNHVWHLRAAVNIDTIRSAGEYLIGEHDFQAFQSKASEAEGKSSVRTITSLEITMHSDLIEVSVSANGFLYNMVRAIVGTLVEIGFGRLQPDDIKRIIKSKDRSLAGPTAPAQGLCLMSVRY